MKTVWKHVRYVLVGIPVVAAAICGGGAALLLIFKWWWFSLVILGVLLAYLIGAQRDS